MCDQGRIREAYDLLEPIHGWFTGGFDTRRVDVVNLSNDRNFRVWPIYDIPSETANVCSWG